MHSPTPGSADDAAPDLSTGTTTPGAYFALAILFSMNLLNYVDRYVFAAVGKSVIDDLKLTDFKFGILAISFMIVYTLLSPAIGWMGDRYSRRMLLACGVGLWSVATVGTTFSRSFYEMCFWRALLGVGEASYGIVAPALLSDLFSRRLRGRAMGLFYLALPLGGALGYAIGGLVSASAWGDRVAYALTGSAQGWRAAFLVVGLPGLAAALGGLTIRDPGRGASERGVPSVPPKEGTSDAPGPCGPPPSPPLPGGGAGEERTPPYPPLSRGGAREGLRPEEEGKLLSGSPPWQGGPTPGRPAHREPARPAEYSALLRTPSYLFNVAGLAAVTFATGALAHWAPTFYQRVRLMEETQANLWIGGLTATAGLLGIGLGMVLPDVLRKRTDRGYLLWASLVVLASVPVGLFGFLSPNRVVSLGFLFVAMVLLASTLGPCNTVPANVIPANRRAAAYALQIFLIHLFGDISSPPLIGWLSDWLGRDDVARSPLGQMLARLGATPVATPDGVKNLTAGMLIVAPMLVLGGLFFLRGSRYLARDQERAHEAAAASG